MAFLCTAPDGFLTFLPTPIPLKQIFQLTLAKDLGLLQWTASGMQMEILFRGRLQKSLEDLEYIVQSGHMKNLLTVALSGLMFLAAACSSQDLIADPSSQSRYSYDSDWENIKEAILSKDVRGLSAYAASDAIDSELIINSFHADPEFLEQLKKATYEDLKVDDSGEEVLLVLSVNVSGSDEDGNEYESGLYLYFFQGEPGLQLVNFLAAG